MINIRSFRPSDIEEVRKIHAEHFINEFDFPDFMNYVCAVVIEDEQGIITTGGIRDIAECVAVTNMNRSAQDRIRALYHLMDASIFACRKVNYDQMYVWSQNSQYTRRLKRNGFKLPVGQSLILDL